jgi:Peptidase propeptide and YPEB domain
MKHTLPAVMLLASFGAHAANLPCSIHPKKGLADTQLAALAKMSQAEAESAALKAVNNRQASVAGGELEAEGGCLIYSFDIIVPGRKSITEVTVDAGTGKVLLQKREGPKVQAAEAAADAAAAVAAAKKK